MKLIQDTLIILFVLGYTYAIIPLLQYIWIPLILLLVSCIINRYERHKETIIETVKEPSIDSGSCVFHPKLLE